MKKLIVALGCTLAVMAGPLAAKDWSKVRIAFDVPYEPFEYKAPDGTLTGFEVDLASAVCKEIKAECDFTIQAWDGLIPGLKARKFDAIMSSMSITDERKQEVLFSEPYYNTPGAWFTKKGSEIEISEANLKGKAIGVQRGTTMDTHVTEKYGKVATIKRYTTADDLVLDLKGGRVNFVFVDYPVGEQTIITDANYVTFDEPVKLGEGVGVAFRKRDEDLANKFNEALRKLKTDGTYDTLMNKYFKYDIKM
jgi:arginine/ornithine transport system substrate-binding protein